MNTTATEATTTRSDKPEDDGVSSTDKLESIVTPPPVESGNPQPANKQTKSKKSALHVRLKQKEEELIQVQDQLQKAVAEIENLKKWAARSDENGHEKQQILEMLEQLKAKVHLFFP